MSASVKMLLLTSASASAGLTVLHPGWFVAFGLLVTILGIDIIAEEQ